jgi:hypothetical protein
MLRIPQKIVNYTTYIFLIISLSSCFQSKVPLTEPDATVVDKSLKGLWYGVNEEKDVYIHVIPQKPPFMRVIKVVYPSKGSDGSTEEFEIFTTFSEGKKFINLKYFMPKESSQTEKQEFELRYMFLMYDLSKNDILTVSGLNYDTWKEAVENKRIKGKAWETTWGTNVTLDETSNNILKFLLSEDTQRQFYVIGKYQRVKVDKTDELKDDNYQNSHSNPDLPQAKILKEITFRKNHGSQKR